MLDDSTDSYMLAAARGVSKAAAIDMAARLKSIYGEYKAGYFGRAYEANAAAIESLVTKPAEGHASSAEIRSLSVAAFAFGSDGFFACFTVATPTADMTAPLMKLA
ncbi:MAG: hypothetical protein HGB05_04030, partial [Chloroflexi bacterium]|nr:hypothetical protein [Chloroflexota bacterium]